MNALISKQISYLTKIIALSALLLALHMTSAYALVVNDPVADAHFLAEAEKWVEDNAKWVAQQATDEARFLKEQYDTLTIENQNAAGTFLKAFGDNLQASLGMKNTQAVVDSIAKAQLDAEKLKNEKIYNIPMENKTCSTRTRDQNAGAAKAGAKSLAAALPNSIPGTTPAQSLNAACLRGNIDAARYPDLAKLNPQCVLDSSRPDRSDADANYSTVSRSNHMSLPDTMKLVNGVLTGFAFTESTSTDSNGNTHTTRTTVSLDDNQKDWVDAYSVCVNLLPHDPPNMAALSGTRPPSIAVLSADSQRLGRAKRTPAFNDCVKEVMRNTRVSYKAGQTLDSVFHTKQYSALSNAQSLACQELVEQGIALGMTTDKCISDGLSDAEIDEIMLNRYSMSLQDKYKEYLTSRSISDPAQQNVLAEEHVDYAMMIRLLREIESTLRAINVNTMPNVSIPGPNGTEN